MMSKIKFYGLRSRVKISLIFALSLPFAAIQAQSPSSPPATASEDEALEDGTHLSIIALGAVPRRRYSKADDGVLEKLLSARPGELPPSALYYKAGKDKGKDKHAKIRIGLNNMKGVFKIKPEKTLKLLQRDRKTRLFSDYMSLPSFPEYAQFIVFLSQKSKKVDRWLNPPTTKILNLNSSKLKNAVLHFQNLSTSSVRVRAGDNNVVLIKPNQGKSFFASELSQLPKVQAFAGKEGKSRLMDTGVRVSGDALTTYAFYDADPVTNSGKSIGTCKVVAKRVKFPEEKK